MNNIVQYILFGLALVLVTFQGVVVVSSDGRVTNSSVTRAISLLDTLSTCSPKYPIYKQTFKITEIKRTSTDNYGNDLLSARFESWWMPKGYRLATLTGKYNEGLQLFTFYYFISGDSGRHTITIQRRGFSWTAEFHVEPVASSIDWDRPTFEGYSRILVCN